MVALITAAMRYFPYFPGDVAVAGLVQSVAPKSLYWARLISLTAAFPLNLLLLTVTCALSWVMAGRRAAFLAILSFGGIWALGTWLSPIIARPRPSPALVQVAGSPPGYSFPSFFALTYASTLGFLALLAIFKDSGRLRVALVTLCCVLLIMGGAARLALGAHWPSDVIISYLLGLLWAAFLIRFAYKA